MRITNITIHVNTKTKNLFTITIMGTKDKITLFTIGCKYKQNKLYKI